MPAVLALPAASWILAALAGSAIIASPAGQRATQQTGQAIADALDDAVSRVKESLREAELSETCKDCDKDPCKPLKKGNPAGKGPYRGGAYGPLKGKPTHAHHTPAHGSGGPLSRWNGPAIQMDEADHANTASYSNSRMAQAYRARQSSLIASGRFLDAVAMDIADVRRVAALAGNPEKYDHALAEMQAYVACLKATNQVQ